MDSHLSDMKFFHDDVRLKPYETYIVLVLVPKFSDCT